MADEFECACYTDRAYPDAIERWPAAERTQAMAAMDKLLDGNPGRMVLEKISYCIGRDHERFPAGVAERFTHALVFQVRLSPRLRLVE